jgi:UDP-N-acetylmuramyl tripeptide synthase
MEDRFSAIRVAIGTAQAKDTVVIAGKGAEDFQEYGDMETGDLIRVGPRFIVAPHFS